MTKKRLPNLELQALKKLKEYTIRYDNLKKACRSRYRKAKKIEVSLTLEEYISLVDSKVCEYCSDKLFRSKSAYGLDRKDNELGYTVTNCVPCCSHCNLFRGRFLSFEEMKQVIKTLQKLRKKKHIWEDFRVVKSYQKWFKKKFK